MKWLNKYIVVISFVWWLMQGTLLFINEIRVWLELNSFDRFFLTISICLITTSCLLLIRKNKIVLLLGILLLSYSIFTLFAMALLFFMEAHGQYIFFAICLCFVIPIINIFLSVMLLKKNKS